jgi:DNA-binding CsgD family transcriptional regulator
MLITLNNAGRAKLSKKWKSRFSLIGAWLAAAVTSIEGRIASATSRGAAMTMTTASHPARGRRAVKFTPQAIEKIKQFVAEGISRDEIANRLDVTVGSLQVTCSRLGISLRRIILSNGSHHTADVRGIPTSCSVGMVRVQEQRDVSQPVARATPFANFAIMMRHKGEEKVTDLRLPSPAIEALALEAMSRDLDIGGLIGQVLVAAINKDMIQEVLR